MNTINGRTPEEIKKGLECCNDDFIPPAITSRCHHCPFDIGDENPQCSDILHNAALAYIQQLESDKVRMLEESHEMRKDMLGRIKQLERERDAAVEQLKEVDTIDLFYCSHCKNEEFSICEFVDCESCDKDCPCATCVDMCNWEWIGAQEVE